MAEIDDTVLVTGGSGFVASHLVNQVLERGYRVHTTVRSLADAAKVAPLRAMQDRFPKRLELFEANLLADGSFDAALRDCRVVFHVASPFLMPEKIKDGLKDVVEPAVTGTRTVLAGIERTPSVERLVFTSTVGAIFAFGLTQDYIRKHLGIRFTVDNHRSVEELGITYRPFEETLTEHYAAWREQRD